MKLTRREVIQTAGRLAALSFAAGAGAMPSLADDGLFEPQSGFDSDTVQNLAKDLAAKPYVDEKIALPQGFDALTYDQYRAIRFNPDKSLWKGEPQGFSFDLFHSGFLYTRPVDVYVVEGGKQARLKYDPNLFIFGPDTPRPSGKDDLHYSGIRLRYPINTKDVNDEFAVFQGASYFRAVGKGMLYGLSARGLAIDTGLPTGEEFPFFRAFWVKKPEPSTGLIVIEALLNSPSVAGAYRFSIKPGPDTQMDVEMTLFPRRDLGHAGIAPLTSMYLFDPMSRLVDDYRYAVHDSDGLMMLTGAGEWLWRPLSNRRTLQVSAFVDQSPRGFGLMQRSRRYEDYNDAEAHYEKRPSLWVEPIGDWGSGDVELFEIPSMLESNDNIVAFWHPRDPLRAGQSQSFVYRLHWCPDWPADGEPVARAQFSGSGAGNLYTSAAPKYDPNMRLYVIDFTGGDRTGQVTPEVMASAGKLSGVSLYPTGVGDRLRLSFNHDATGVDAAEFRAVLKNGDKPVSETWLYRWTRA